MTERYLILRKELESLLNEEKDFRFQTEEDFEKFKRENIFSFERLKYIRNKIREIKWELMTDEEK
jgi:hypothetical protein